MFTCNDCKNAKENNDLTKSKILDKVKTLAVTKYSYIIDSGKYVKGGIISKLISHYDEKGMEVDVNVYNKDEYLTNKFQTSNNDKGQKLESKDFKPDGSLGRKIAYKYDNSGNMTEINLYTASDSLVYKGKKI